MVSSKILIARFKFVLMIELLRVLAVILAIIHLPVHLLRKCLTSPRVHRRPCVKLSIHEPASRHSTPRDTLVFIHGFPDNSSLWDHTVAHLTAAGYRCITIDLPGSKGEPVPYAIYPTDTVKMIVEALTPVCNTSFTLVGHDWGAAYSTLLTTAKPQLVHRLVLLDVGMLTPHSDTHWTVWLCILSYQSFFALLFFLGESCIGIQRFLVRYWNYNVRPLEEVTTDMNYHYAGAILYLVKHVVRRQREPPSNATTQPVPHLFLYAQKKLFHFHDAAFLEAVQSSPHGEVVALPCEHWMMYDLAESWVNLLTEWLQKSEPAILQEQ